LTLLSSKFKVKGGAILCSLISEMTQPTRADPLVMNISLGKRDSHPVHFALWDDHDCPDFSPVRALLLWMSFTGIRGGYLFPSLDQLGKTRTPDKSYGYESILNDYKLLC
jgi:hypothetical protein